MRDVENYVEFFKIEDNEEDGDSIAFMLSLPSAQLVHQVPA